MAEQSAEPGESAGGMSAGTFIAACFGKTTAELRAANVASAARQHGIPVAWASYYLNQELSGRSS